MSHVPAYSIRVKGGRIQQYQFDNGYGATVSRWPNQYLYQLGVTKQPGDELMENSPAFKGAILTGLLRSQVEEWLDKIASLDNREITT